MQSEENFEMEQRKFEDVITLWGVFRELWQRAKCLGEGSKVGEGRDQVRLGRKGNKKGK